MSDKHASRKPAEKEPILFFDLLMLAIQAFLPKEEEYANINCYMPNEKCIAMPLSKNKDIPDFCLSVKKRNHPGGQKEAFVFLTEFTLRLFEEHMPIQDEDAFWQLRQLTGKQVAMPEKILQFLYETKKYELQAQSQAMADRIPENKHPESDEILRYVHGLFIQNMEAMETLSILMQKNKKENGKEKK